MRKLAPIVLFAYNRPEHVAQTLEALHQNRLSGESDLYIFADGPKPNTTEQNLKNISQVREVLKVKQWCKSVHIFEQSINKGLATSIIEGVSQVIEEHGKVIVLEDDIVTSAGFLEYMNDALDCYEHEERVMHITGYFYPIKVKAKSTFFFNQTSCWGWATWQSAWKYFEKDAVALNNRLLSEKKSIGHFNINNSYDFYSSLKRNITGEMNTWAVKWYASVYLQNGFCLHPAQSLVQNIGLEQDGTHFVEGVNGEMYKNESLAPAIEVEKLPILEDRGIRRQISVWFRGGWSNYIKHEAKLFLKRLGINYRLFM